MPPKRLALLVSVALLAILLTPRPGKRHRSDSSRESVPRAQQASALTPPVSVRSAQKELPPKFSLAAIDHAPLMEKATRLEQELGRYRFATQRPVQIKTATHGSWTSLGQGRSRWGLDIASAGAESINLAFSKFSLPPGAKLTLTGLNDLAKFTFTSRDNDEHGQLWTPILRGEAVRLALEVPDALAPAVRLQLASVNHGFRGLRKSGSKIGSDSSSACNIDVVCSTSDDAVFGALIDMYRDQIRAVGAYTLNGIDTCSGALINNSTNDNTPYFLTAYHCEVRAADAPSMVVYWNFENSTCRQPNSVESGLDGDGPLTQFNSGAVLRADHSTTDFTLVELDDPVDPAANPFFAGWDRSGIHPSSAVGIHHPAVAEKRISFELDPTTTTTPYSSTSPGAGTHIRVADWDFGTTEGGSSGSSLFDDTGRIIGQLDGGDAACGNDESDWYGRLAVSWDGAGEASSRLSDWLDPIDTGQTAIDGVNSDELIELASTSFTEGDSGQQVITLSLSLSPSTTDTVTARVQTTDVGSATPGIDFAPLDTIATFAAGETTTSVDLIVFGDTQAEEHETIGIELSEASNAIAPAGTNPLIILNDDYITPSINSPLTSTAFLGQPIDYQITALGTPTAYGLGAAPAGMSVDTLTGTLSWIPSATGEETVEITASTPAGTTTETVVITVLSDSLAEALDLPPGFPTSTNELPWVLQTLITHDGKDAAASGAIADFFFSTLSVSVTGPDFVRFWWRVSSEEDFDFLSLQLDGLLVTEISGETGWLQRGLIIPPGNHNISWTYAKDDSFSDGLDKAWVDEIVFASTIPEPQISSDNTGVAFAGQEFSYQIVATKSPTHYGADDLPAGLAVDPMSGLLSGIPAGVGPWSFVLWAENEEGRGTLAFSLSQAHLDPALPPAIEAPSLAVQNDSPQPWLVDASNASAGSSSAQAGSIEDDGTTTFTALVEGPGELSFDWKVSSEQDFDFLIFYMDGTEIEAITGEIDWTNTTIELAPGSHELTWAYEKDGSDLDGEDTGWVDNLSLSGYAGFVTDAGLRLGQALPNSNPDADPYPNLLEYVLDGDPTSALTPVAPEITELPAGDLRFTFTGLASPSDAAISLQQSTSLEESTWTETNIVPTLIPSAPDRADYQFDLPSPLGIDRRFYRLNAAFTSSN